MTDTQGFQEGGVPSRGPGPAGVSGRHLSTISRTPRPRDIPALSVCSALGSLSPPCPCHGSQFWNIMARSLKNWSKTPCTQGPVEQAPGSLEMGGRGPWRTLALFPLQTCRLGVLIAEADNLPPRVPQAGVGTLRRGEQASKGFQMLVLRSGLVWS